MFFVVEKVSASVSCKSIISWSQWAIIILGPWCGFYPPDGKNTLFFWQYLHYDNNYILVFCNNILIIRCWHCLCLFHLSINIFCILLVTVFEFDYFLTSSPLSIHWTIDLCHNSIDLAYNYHKCSINSRHCLNFLHPPIYWPYLHCLLIQSICWHSASKFSTPLTLLIFL